MSSDSMNARRSGSGKTSARSSEDLRSALGRYKKSDLLDCLVELARNDIDVRHRIAEHLDFDLSRDTIVEENRKLIEQATWCDPRDVNRNFHYDHAAYEKVCRNFKSMIASEVLDEAMDQAKLLMKRGSHQVVTSDEGPMLEEIEACLEPVLRAVERARMPARAKLKWLRALKRADEMGDVCSLEIERIQTLCETAREASL